MELFFALWILCGTITIINSHGQPTESSVTVYPQVFEGRGNNFEKLLVLHEGYSLKLTKGSVLAESVLLQDLTADGVVETYIDGRQHEKDLYQDSENMASLLIKPQAGGHYHIHGLVNTTHLIEPLPSFGRSLEGSTAHRISAIKMNRGTHGFITATERSVPIPKNAKPATGKLPRNFTIEVALYSDYKHTIVFQSTAQRIEYLQALMLGVSLRYQQLGSRCSIVITSIIGSRIENEYYVHRRNANEIYGKETLEKLAAVLKRNQATVRADVAFLLTGRNVVQWNGKTITANHVGLAFVGQACAYFKTGLGMDDPLTFSGLHTAAHELGHLLNSTHDGEGGSAKCRADYEHLMHAYEGGERNYLFSSCSVNAINEFLRSESSFCLKESATFLKYYLPDGVLKKEGPYLTGAQILQTLFSELQECIVCWAPKLSFRSLPLPMQTDEIMGHAERS
ncbi:hypothetical protein MTO96_012419 [Rhipicephalus appendiculatus]